MKNDNSPLNKSYISDTELEKFYLKVIKEAQESGYHLNPDEEFSKYLLNNILLNKERYGYGACPCRLSSGNKDEDMDIICPCDYRDPDLNDYDACYCGLYVSGEILEDRQELTSIPERRPAPDERGQRKTDSNFGASSSLEFPVYRCSVCGYLCAREEPPETCPICKVGKERFNRFI